MMALVAPSDGPTRRLGAGGRRRTTRDLQPERLPPGRPRADPARSAPSTSISCSSPGAIWFPMVYAFPQKMKDALGRRKRSNEQDRALRYAERDRRPPRRSPARGRRRSSTTSCSISTTSTATPPTSSATSPRSSPTWPSTATTGPPGGARARRSSSTASAARWRIPAGGSRAPVHRQAALPGGVQGAQAAGDRGDPGGVAARPGGDPAGAQGMVRAAARDGRPDLRRRRRRGAARPRRPSTVRRRLPGPAGVRLGRGGVPLPLPHRPGAWSRTASRRARRTG